MHDVTLHFKAQISSRECAVCGARLDRSDRDHWWLRNTWTSAVQDYYEGGGMWPTDWLTPCGVLPADYALGAAIGAVASLNAPNARLTCPQGRERNDDER